MGTTREQHSMINKINSFVQAHDMIKQNRLSKAKKFKNNNDAENEKVSSIPEIINNVKIVGEPEEIIPEDQYSDLDEKFVNYRKENEQLKFELETLQNLLNTAIDENKSYISDNKQLRGEILLNKRRYDEHVRSLKDDQEEEINKLNIKIQDLTHTVNSMKNDSKSELKIQDKIIERLK